MTHFVEGIRKVVDFANRWFPTEHLPSIKVVWEMGDDQ
jgi:hypothetical protein